jgi:FtsP/CotA-like multicopper oxidase with cupredoxin domain
VTAEVEEGVTFEYMTFDGQVPGPMIRARVGNTVDLTVTNAEGNRMPHNVDLHAVRDLGGSAEATTVAPGETARVYYCVGGPNLASSFHPIGSVWDELYPQGGLGGRHQRSIQTTPSRRSLARAPWP